MQNSWFSLVPPIIVVSAAFITRNLAISLILGLIIGGLIVADGSLFIATSLIGNRLFEHLQDVDSLYTYAFLLIIATIIALLNRTGGAIACAQSIIRKISSKKTAETSSVLLSHLLAIDDYLSILTTGYVMQAITDQFKIPRLKLAFLVHSLAGVVVILVPISTWVAFLTSQLDLVGINLANAETTKITADPFFIHLQTIPFIFYSLLMIASVLFIIRRGLSFGPMHSHEQAKVSHEIEHKKVPTHTDFAPIRGTTTDLLLPLFTLWSTVLIGIAYMGDYWIFGGTRSLLGAFQNNDQAFFVMFIAGIITLTASSIFALVRNVIKVNELSNIAQDGFLLMYSPIIVVILASTLGAMLKSDLLTGQYLANILLGTLPIALLPVTFFIVTLIVALFTGSAWGTFALMLSIAIPMLISLLQVIIPVDPNTIPILFPVLGAIFSGAVCGDHISPISETTVMTATSTDSDPIKHSYTQFLYALPAILSSMVAFLLTGYLIYYPLWLNVIISLGTGTCICFAMLYILNYVWEKT